MEVLPSSPLRLQMTTNSLGDDLGLQPQAWGCLWGGDRVAARGSLWWEGWAGEDRSEPRLWLGRLGGLEATDAEAAIAFLHQACEILRQRGCSQVLGPMDGSTWQSYRCALNWENGPPFWGEPQTDPCWVNWLTQAGFTPVAKYESRLCLDLRQTHRPRRRRHSLPSVRIQSAQGLTAEALLPHIHTLVMASFRRQPFFQPWPETVFTQHLRPLLSQMDPELIHLAWDQDRLVGLVLALPDGLATDGRRLIIKTLAIWPGRAYAGLGATLLESAHHAGFRQGYRQAIHALMHSQNPSLSLSRRYSQPFRDYVLMGKNLT